MKCVVSCLPDQVYCQWSIPCLVLMGCKSARFGPRTVSECDVWSLSAAWNWLVISSVSVSMEVM